MSVTEEIAVRMEEEKAMDQTIYGRKIIISHRKTVNEECSIKAPTSSTVRLLSSVGLACQFLFRSPCTDGSFHFLFHVHAHGG